jgi:hypothetical protein
MVDRGALPAGWGVRPELLPPMGASPDAMLHHRAVPAASALGLSTSAAAPAAQPAAGGAPQGGVAGAAVPPRAAAGAFAAGQRVANSEAVSRGFQQPLGLTAAPGSAPGVRTSAARAPAAQPVNGAAGWGNGLAPGGRALQPAGVPTERGLRLCSELESELRASKVTHQPQPQRAAQPAGQPTSLAADIEALLQRLQLSTQQKQRPGATALASAQVAEASGPESAPFSRGNGSAPAQRHLQPPPQAAGAPYVLGADEAGGRLEMVEVKNT